MRAEFIDIKTLERRHVDDSPIFLEFLRTYHRILDAKNEYAFRNKTLLPSSKEW